MLFPTRQSVSVALPERLCNQSEQLDALRRLLELSESHDGRLCVRRATGQTDRLLRVEALPQTIERIKRQLVDLLLDVHSRCSLSVSLRVLLPRSHSVQPLIEHDSDSPHSARHFIRELSGPASAIAAEWMRLGRLTSLCKSSSLTQWLLDRFPECCGCLPVGSDGDGSCPPPSSSPVGADGLLVCIKTLMSGLAGGDDTLDALTAEVERRTGTLIRAIRPKAFVMLAFESLVSSAAEIIDETDAMQVDQEPHTSGQSQNLLDQAVRCCADSLVRHHPGLCLLLLPCRAGGTSTAIFNFIQSQIAHSGHAPVASRSYCVYGIDADTLLLSLSPPVVSHPALHLSLIQRWDTPPASSDTMDIDPSPASASSSVWCDALEVVWIDRLREALRSYVKAQMESLGVTASSLDVDRYVEDLRMLWAWSATGHLPSLLDCQRHTKPKLGADLDTITHIYFAHLEDKCVDTSPFLFHRGRVHPAALDHFVNSIRAHVEYTRFGYPPAHPHVASQKVSTYLAGLSELIAYYTGERSDGKGLTTALSSPPWLQNFAYHLASMTPSQLEDPTTSFELPEMELLAPLHHQLATKMLLPQSIDGDVSVRFGSDGITGQLKDIASFSDSAHCRKCRFIIPRPSSSRRSSVASLTPVPRGRRPSAVGSLPMRAPGFLRVVAAAGLWEELVDLMPPAEPVGLARVCHTLYEAVYGVITVVSFVHPNQGKIRKVDATFVRRAVVILPPKVESIEDQLMAFCLRRLSLYASQLQEMSIVDPLKRKRAKAGDREDQPPHGSNAAGVVVQALRGLAMTRLAALHIESVAGLALFERMRLRCPSMGRLTGRIVDVVDLCAEPHLPWWRPNPVQRWWSRHGDPYRLSLLFDDCLASFCRRHPQLTALNVFPLAPSRLPLTFNALGGMDSLTHLGHVLVPPLVEDGDDYSSTWEDCGEVMALLKRMEERRWQIEEDRQHSERKSERAADRMAESGSGNETETGPSVPARTLVIHTPIVLNLSLPADLLSRHAVANPRPLRLIREIEEWGGTVIRSGGVAIMDCSHEDTPDIFDPRRVFSTRQESLQSLKATAPLVRRYARSSDRVVIVCGRYGKSVLSLHPDLQSLDFPAAKVLKVLTADDKADELALQAIPKCIGREGVFANIQELRLDTVERPPGNPCTLSPPPFDNNLCSLLRSLPSDIKIALDSTIPGFLVLESLAYFQGGTSGPRKTVREVKLTTFSSDLEELSTDTALSSEHGFLPTLVERRQRYPQIAHLTMELEEVDDFPIDDVVWLIEELQPDNAVSSSAFVADNLLVIDVSKENASVVDMFLDEFIFDGQLLCDDEDDWEDTDFCPLLASATKTSEVKPSCFTLPAGYEAALEIRLDAVTAYGFSVEDTDLTFTKAPRVDAMDASPALAVPPRQRRITEFATNRICAVPGSIDGTSLGSILVTLFPPPLSPTQQRITDFFAPAGADGTAASRLNRHTQRTHDVAAVGSGAQRSALNRTGVECAIRLVPLPLGQD
ncbi:unnamed protein product [Vitrella brassicaformis CCMP3155]|uniref:Uncharacterized protein n=2 Tax=Vitrella brassicaformis TaxID=1169539 RepID=A0A0G4EIF9_VITBC|nr:unnamed protein product [Vitrella brassicaformis CCMP3155]|eukprot:CEL95667.1 unnamed protein product [Vitrella brassicaformis CCMP3155]